MTIVRLKSYIKIFQVSESTIRRDLQEVLVYSLLSALLAETATWVTAAGTVTASKLGTQECSLARSSSFKIIIQTNGDDEEMAANALLDLVDSKFGEE